ncbi:MAG: autoinducer-2 kinase [Clostridiales bacterium]|jgi:autoinducer 2 (AI-2) kinase|nr:autoinducer-2 kinase [Clostridiales bacterium]
MGKYLLAIDGGTGSIRSCLFDYDGRQICIASREWVHLQDPRYPGSMDFDCAKNWELTKQTIAEVLETAGIDSSEITAIAASSMREGIVLYDEDNREIFSCANVDARASAQGPELKEKVPGIEEEIYRISGQTFSLGAIVRLLWVKNNAPEIYEKTKKMTMLNDWLTFKLTGILSSEPSNGCTTGMFDIKKRVWDTGILEKCSLKPDIYAPVYECGEKIGYISNECAAETGLSVTTAVVSGGGDAQLGAVGVGVVSEKQNAIFGGSFWQVESNTETPKIDAKCRLKVNCHAVKGMWQYEAIAFYPGLVMKWYRDAFCGHEKKIAAETGISVYAQMEKEAEKVPAGCYGMLCAFSDVMNYIQWKHASPTFMGFGLDAEKFNRYTFYRAIMENAAYISRGHLELIREVTGNYPQSVIFANGSSKSKLWCQILADVLNVTVKVPVVREATALGAAICAGVGAGVYANVAQACERVVKLAEEYLPNADNAGVYADMYAKWRKAYKAQLALADSGVLPHMWKAPGL